MAHDKQFRESGPGVEIIRFDCPKKGEYYWNRDAHRIEEAVRDMGERFCIVKGEAV